MPSLYPLKFHPIYKDKIWGGQQVRTVLGHDFSPLGNCGELWALSGVPDDESVITNGFLQGNTLSEITEIYMDELLGDKVYQQYGEVFPVLIKFIDTTDWLSVQVHPDDEMAQRLHEEPFGKTEMWYIVRAGQGAELISGFERDTTQQEFIEALQQKKLNTLLHHESVQAGDVFFVPAGRVHAIGPDILLAEIQQTSDLTYRVYDWDRIGVDGLPRELHMVSGLQAMDYKAVGEVKAAYEVQPDRRTEVVQCPAFTTNLLSLKNGIRVDYSERDSFVVLVCTSGALTVTWTEGSEHLSAGEVLLLPALMENVELKPSGSADVLEVYMP